MHDGAYVIHFNFFFWEKTKIGFLLLWLLLLDIYVSLKKKNTFPLKIFENRIKREFMVFLAKFKKLFIFLFLKAKTQIFREVRPSECDVTGWPL